MTETTKAKVGNALARRFKRRAMAKRGYKKGAIKKALEEAIREYVPSGKVHWEPFRGTLKSNLSSVELQHYAWKNDD